MKMAVFVLFNAQHLLAGLIPALLEGEKGRGRHSETYWPMHILTDIIEPKDWAWAVHRAMHHDHVP